MSWMVDEYPVYQRSWRWYVVTTVIGAGLLMYALVTVNFLFALIIAIFGIVTAISMQRTPVRVRVALMEDGVAIGHRFIPWLDVTRFWMVYEPPQVKMLYLDFKNTLRPDLALSLEDQNPSAVRHILLQYVQEDLNKDSEPVADFLGRLMKI